MRRGFTLIEVVMALAVSAIIAAAALTAFVSVSRATRKIEQQAAADDEAKVLADVIMTRVQQAGGGQLRPWMVIEVDDNAGAACAAPLALGAVTLPACDASGTASDRLHVVVAADATQCTLATVAPSPAAPTSATSPPATCCLTAADFANKSLLLVGADGSGVSTGAWRSSFCTSVDTTACTCATPAGLNGFASAAVRAGAPATLLDNGVMTAGTTLSFFLDRTTGILQIASDEDDDGVVEIAELADHVEDFQVQLGFDTNGDQIVDRFDNGYPTGAGAPTRAQLRAIRVGIIIAAPVAARDTPTSERLMNGSVRTYPRGMYLRKVQTTTTLRNLDIFL